MASEFKVKRPVSYEGQTDLIEVTSFARSPGYPGGANPWVVEGREYLKVEGNVVVTYGYVALTTQNGQTSTESQRYDPPQRDLKYTLMPNETAANTASTTLRYLGQESVTVPAGTYMACRFEVSNNSGRVISRQWYAKTNDARTNGLVIKSETWVDLFAGGWDRRELENFTLLSP